MNTDIRLSTGFVTHPKTVKLIRRLGHEGVFSLIALWTWTAQNRNNGVLSDMDEEDVEIAAAWGGEPGKLIEGLLALRFMERQDDAFYLHDWSEHQEYVVQEDARREKARKAAMARWGNAPSMSDASGDDTGHDASGMPQACSKQCSMHAPSMPQASPSNAPSQAFKDLRECVLNAPARVKANSVPDEKPTPAPGRAPDMGFEQFFEAYPDTRRGGRMEAEKAWLALAAGHALPGLPRLFESLTRWEESEAWKRQGGRFIPSAGKFLEREYWNREPPEPEAEARASPPGPRALSVRDAEVLERDQRARWLLERRAKGTHDAQPGRDAGPVDEPVLALPADKVH